MSLHRHNPKRDANEPEIVEALRQVVDNNDDVELNSQAGVPDLRVWFRNEMYWLEVKTKKGKLSEGQRKWIERAKRCGENVTVVRTVEDALQAIGAID